MVGFLVYNTGHKVGNMQMAPSGLLLYMNKVIFDRFNYLVIKPKKGRQISFASC